MRFQREDFLELYKQLSARTKHVFNLLLPDEYGAFLNLIQHHGYPTPILDWTYSPYVAAFFAYRGVSNEDAAKSDPAAKVRIHVLDQARWKSQQRMFSILGPSELHFSIFEFSAIENERMIPQQAASTVTNVDDIEEFIKSKEVDAAPYLRAIDLSVGERKKVVKELGYILFVKLSFAFLLVIFSVYQALGIGHRFVRRHEGGETVTVEQFNSILGRLKSANWCILLLAAITIWLGLRMRG